MCDIGKYVWAIANKEDNLWVKWIHTVYIKQEDWWAYKAPSSSSWYWKQIVRVKDGLKETYQGIVLSWPYYNIAKLYNLMKNKTETRWKFSSIWDRLGIPKHKFVDWLVLMQRMPTKDRLFRFGITEDSLCVICGQYVESHRHLFFECQFSKSCQASILTWLRIGSHRIELAGIMNWIRRSRHSACRRRVYYCSLSACVYHIWRARNSAYWKLHVPLVGFVTQNIKTEVCNRFCLLFERKLGKEDLKWVRKLQCN
ncbi:uncharacterized protein LOC133824418 [Humulus lupulus]|uniref:uncharacterized protein LOC133824418 n=1 Tax=Humulus lupulus TaxID=3486 RepID=UPI002B40BAA5|nr:uncharacterized protein LOC133824418 [Humulus lupulus]